MLDANEIEALDSIVRTLDGLQVDSRIRVMLYLRGRLDAMGISVSLGAPHVVAPSDKSEKSDAREKRKVADIRQLRSDKSPRSDVEMTALVGYYLKEEAPDDERKNTFDRDDLERYFKLAGHPLPSRLGMTLTNAKNAGYLDVVGQGEYRLNAVGYNLVAHNLPATSATGKPARKKRSPSARKATKRGPVPPAKRAPKRTGAAKPAKSA